jgi:hypothetical protein
MRLPTQAAPVIREMRFGAVRHRATGTFSLGGVHPAAANCPHGESCSCGGSCGTVCCNPNNGCHCSANNMSCLCN